MEISAVKTLRKTIFYLLVFLVSFVPLVLAQGTYTQVDYPGAAQTTVWGIDTAGDVVGSYVDASGNGHGFLLSGGTYTTIDYPGGYNFLTGINDLGMIVGFVQFSNGGFGFLYNVQTGVFTEVNYPGASTTLCYAINNAGTIVGSFLSGAPYEGFALIGSNYHLIEPPGSTQAIASGITASGQVVGNSLLTGDVNFNFLFNGRRYRQLIPRASIRGAILDGISPSGTALTGYSSTLGGYAGFLLQNKVLTVLRFPTATGTVARAVSDTGEVVGWFLDSAFVQHGFLWTPPGDAAKK